MSDNDRLLETITADHARLAAFGREWYALNGRGLIHVEYPSVAPGVRTNVSPQMLYEDAETVRDLMADYPEIADDAAVTLGMIDTYDPERQAVVLASFQGGNPIAMKMRLDLPVSRITPHDAARAAWFGETESPEPEVGIEPTPGVNPTGF